MFIAPKKSTYKRILWIIVILLILAGLYFMWQARQVRSEPIIVNNVKVINAVPFKLADTTLTSTYVGYVTPIKSVNLVPNVAGYIEEVWVNGGDNVKIGDKLLKIDERQYSAALDSAKADVAQARAEFDNAATFYKRVKRAGQKAVSKTATDNAKARYLSAKGNLEAALAEQNKAQVLYDYTLLSSSIDGVVGNVDLTKGNYVSPASGALISIIQSNPIRVVFSVSDKDYLNEIATNGSDNIFADKKIRLRLANGNLYESLGKFSFTANNLDKSTGTIAVYAEFANPDKELLANAYVDVLLEKELKNGAVIRQNYISIEPEGNFVYTVKNSELLKNPVKILGEENGNYFVANNFSAEEYLVTDKIGTISSKSQFKIKLNRKITSADEEKF